MHFSGLRILKEALTGHKGWKPLWRDPVPMPAYDFVIIRGGGHGLATAFYLAKTFGQAKVAVLEKGWRGSSNIGRNTTIIRSNSLLPGNAMPLAGAYAQLPGQEEVRAAPLSQLRQHPLSDQGWPPAGPRCYRPPRRRGMGQRARRRQSATMSS